MSTENVAADELRLLIERIERLEEEKKGIADGIKDVKSEAKSRGFNVATINAIIKLRKMDVNERREAEALLDTYKAALGMLDGTPLGKWAIDRLSGDDKDDEPDAPTPTPPAPEKSITVDEARSMGEEAARDGRPVTSNPFPARDIRRAAWDEAWCAALGSDGMDIPDTWKPSPKKKEEKQSEAAE